MKFVGWFLLLIAAGWGIALAFLYGVSHERERWEMALGGCELPAGKTDAVMIYRDEFGRAVCYRGANPWFRF